MTRGLKPGFEDSFLKWCVEQVGAGERIRRSRWIADEMGSSANTVGQFLAFIVAECGGCVGCYRVERWNNESQHNISIWRVSYAFPSARGVGLSSSIPSCDEPCIGHPAPTLQKQYVGGVG